MVLDRALLHVPEHSGCVVITGVSTFQVAFPAIVPEVGPTASGVM